MLGSVTVKRLRRRVSWPPGWILFNGPDDSSGPLSHFWASEGSLTPEIFKSPPPNRLRSAEPILGSWCGEVSGHCPPPPAAGAPQAAVLHLHKGKPRHESLPACCSLRASIPFLLAAGSRTQDGEGTSGCRCTCCGLRPGEGKREPVPLSLDWQLSPHSPSQKRACQGSHQ